MTYNTVKLTMRLLPDHRLPAYEAALTFVNEHENRDIALANAGSRVEKVLPRGWAGRSSGLAWWSSSSSSRLKTSMTPDMQKRRPLWHWFVARNCRPRWPSERRYTLWEKVRLLFSSGYTWEGVERAGRINNPEEWEDRLPDA